MSKPVVSIRLISTLEDFAHRLWLVDALTDEPLIAGTVSVAFCQKDTATPYSTCALTHHADGEWRGVHESTQLASELPVIGTVFDRVLMVAGTTGGSFIDRWQRVAVAPLQGVR